MRSMAVNNDVKNAFGKYLKNAKITLEKPDAREPDFLFYDGYSGILNIYRLVNMTILSLPMDKRNNY